MSKTILIIEDEKALQDVFTLVLTYKGYTVYVADNGLEGLKQLKATKPDLILLDLFMPIMDGKEFLRNVDITDYPATKFVVYTNVSDGDMEVEMLGLGAHKVVLKSSLTPQDLTDLVAKLTSE